MGKPYDIALRKKAIEMHTNGEKRSLIVSKLDIGIATLNRWIKRNKEGKLEPRVKSYMGGGRKVKHQDVVDYVHAHPNSFLRQIGEVFGVRAQTVLYILKRNGVALKGRRGASENFFKNSQPKNQTTQQTEPVDAA